MNKNGKITAPVTARDIQLVLGTDETRQSRLCLSEAVNKYSIKKPIVYPTKGGKCPNFKGYAQDNDNGIYYGLRVAGNNWGMQIHAANWEYVRPTGELGIAPFRRLDFDGYNHLAQPSMVGSIVSPTANINYNDTIPFTCNITFNTLTNNDGVDVRACTNDTEAIFYVCVAIDNSIAIMRDDNGNVAPLPAYEWATYTFRCPALPSWLKNTSSRQISVFIANLADAGTKDLEQLLDGEWVVFDEAKAGVQYITIPEAVGYVANFAGGGAPAVDYGMLILEVTYSAKKTAFNVDIEWTTKPSADRDYILRFSLVGLSDTIQFPFNGGTGKGTSEVITEADLGVRFIEGETYTYKAEIYGYEGQVITPQPLVSQTGTITIE